MELRVLPYVRECVHLCWLMCLQDPPVVLGDPVRPGDMFNPEMYRAYTSVGPKVAFVVWPALHLHSGGPLLYKGVAQGLKETR